MGVTADHDEMSHGYGDFSARLRAARSQAGLSQEELAERSGLSVRAIGNLERGRIRRPFLDTVNRLADSLGLSATTRADFVVAAGHRPAAPATRADVATGPATVPRQLPAAIPDFTGRSDSLEVLTKRWEDARAAGGTMIISVIDGPPGVGKTALAVVWAHQVAGAFPDGQLYLNLRGFDPSGKMVPPESAVRAFLDALGVPAERIPSRPESQAAQYRSLLADKRMLIVLDNARNAEQVRPLLPGGSGCMVVVTSRVRLAGLAAAEGAGLLTLDVLSAHEAGALLTSRLGPARSAAEPGAVAELARLCGRLPLALSVAAALAMSRPRVPLATVAAELATAGRLSALDTGDPATNVRTVFSWSCRNLDEPAARMFRLLGVHPGPDITVPAAAALMQVPAPHASAALAALAMANLIEELTPHRYTAHDLLHAYAVEQAAELEPAAARSAALHRVLDYYLHTSHDAALLLNPSGEPVNLGAPQPGVTPERISDKEHALAWFDAEHRVLIAAVAAAAEAGFDACAWQLAWALDTFLDWRGFWQEWAATQRIALAAATRLGDLAGQATAGRLLGHSWARLGDYDKSRAQLTESLRLYELLGDQVGQGRIHQTLGWLAERQGRNTDALGHAEQALVLYQATGDKDRLAAALNNVGWCHALLGSYQRSREFTKQALEAYREIGHLPGEANIWDSLGNAEHNLGNLAAAKECYRNALAIVTALGDRYHQAEYLTHLGEVQHTAREQAEARDSWQDALAILEELDHPDAISVRERLTMRA
ncbi:tetratricopeptide repeat protein [Actinoplanes subtropicus]|uniref:tetratricopeptide repeat protein n=1 Tax=Actinoplanes subtropicus TaxID=543632 RepID=UPI00068D2ED4|nr:tetratricopeptide repeat protein [Actinoplanes subtropicus]